MAGIAGAGMYQENSPLIEYRGTGWNRVAWAQGLGGYVKKTTSAGAGLTLRFQGTEISVYTVRGPGRGAPAIAIDGVARGQYDLAAESESKATLPFTGLTPGEHTIDVDLVDPGALLEIDGFEVKGLSSLPVIPTPTPAPSSPTIPSADQVKAWAKKNPLLAVAAGFLGARMVLGPKGFRLF